MSPLIWWYNLDTLPGKEFISMLTEAVKYTHPFAQSNFTSRKQCVLRKSEMRNQIFPLGYLSPTLGIRVMFMMKLLMIQC